MDHLPVPNVPCATKLRNVVHTTLYLVSLVEVGMAEVEPLKHPSIKPGASIAIAEVLVVLSWW